MRTISYMYQQSGGTEYHHICKECFYCRKETDGISNSFRKGTASYTCMKHPDGRGWNESWTACRFFNDENEKEDKKKQRKPKKRTEPHQMTIDELMLAAW